MKFIKTTILSIMMAFTSTMIFATDINTTANTIKATTSQKVKAVKDTKKAKLTKATKEVKAVKDAKKAQLTKATKDVKAVKNAKKAQLTKATKDVKAVKDSKKAQITKATKALKSLNVNTATAKELSASLKGIGIKKAQAIVDYRKKYGKFKSAADLLKVKGIGKNILENNATAILFK